MSERKVVFWQGVFDGVTGIVRKPIEGAQKEGVEGFFKGTDTSGPVKNNTVFYNLKPLLFP